MMVHAGAARALVPTLDGLSFGANGFVQRLAERSGDLDLAERRRADQFVSGARMASARQRRRSSFGDIIEIDEAKPGLYRVGYAIDAVADHAIPLRKAVLHVGGWLQNRDVEGGGEQHLLDPQLVPGMRHRFDLRITDGMVAWAGDAQIGRGSDQPFGKNDFVRANVRTDVIDRFRP